ncbi:PiggyBac transposable element-derived protein 2 [Nymphon striatum]|nr:PiggyBac transposable element-derived protein 2 [Nymphon striatum]
MSKGKKITGRKGKFEELAGCMIAVKFVKTPAMEFGIKNEGRAADQYSAEFGLKTLPVGFVINPSASHLECSPDRRVYDAEETNPWGLVEIKCTVKHSVEECDYLKECSNSFELKRSHADYEQCQGQMAITGARNRYTNRFVKRPKKVCTSASQHPASRRTTAKQKYITRAQHHHEMISQPQRLSSSSDSISNSAIDTTDGDDYVPSEDGSAISSPSKHSVNELKANQKHMEDDIDRLKLALVIDSRVDTEERKTLVDIPLHKDFESFQDFASHLEDAMYKKLVVTMESNTVALNDALNKVLRLTSQMDGMVDAMEKNSKPTSGKEGDVIMYLKCHQGEVAVVPQSCGVHPFTYNSLFPKMYTQEIDGTGKKEEMVEALLNNHIDVNTVTNGVENINVSAPECNPNTSAVTNASAYGNGRHVWVSSMAGDVVLKLASTLPSDKNHKLFANNYFTCFPLIRKLSDWGIQCVGTIRVNRLKGCDLKSEKVLQREGRGSHDAKVEEVNGIAIVRWFDNKAVETLVFSYYSVDPVGTARRWSKDKSYINLNKPAVVEYNKFMGGVGLMDMLSALYKYSVKSMRWYLYIWFHT